MWYFLVLLLLVVMSVSNQLLEATEWERTRSYIFMIAVLLAARWSREDDRRKPR